MPTHDSFWSERQQTEQYIKEVLTAFGDLDLKDPADSRFFDFLSVIAPYFHASMRANFIEDTLIPEIRHPESNADKTIQEMYQNMPAAEKERLLQRLQKEVDRLRVIEEQQKEKARLEQEKKEQLRLQLFKDQGFVLETPPDGFVRSVRLLGQEYYYNFFGFKKGDRLSFDDGEWVASGWKEIWTGEIGIFFIRPDVFAQIEDFKKLSKEEALAEYEKLGKFEEKFLTQEELKELREK